MGCKSCLANDIEEIYDLSKINGLFRFYNKNGECYINSFLQIILHNKILLEIINSIDKNNDKMILINELLRLLNEAKTASIILDPNNVKNIMISINEAYTNNGEDISNLISDFINELSLELPKNDKYKILFPEDEIAKNALNKLIKRFYTNNYSEFTEIFYGNNMIEYTCKKGHLINVKFMAFITLDLSIYSFTSKEEISLKEIIDNKFQLKNIAKFVKKKY